jgi:hypothetical protein
MSGFKIQLWGRHNKDETIFLRTEDSVHKEAVESFVKRSIYCSNCGDRSAHVNEPRVDRRESPMEGVSVRR